MGRPARSVDPKERFENLVARIPFHPCWEWTGARMNNGYGEWRWARERGRGKKITAHRASYMLYVGEIPSGMFVCHKCDNRGCVRPDHLFLGTASDNNKDCAEKGRRPKREAHWNARLNCESVTEIRRLRSRGLYQREIAALMGVSRGAVNDVLNAYTWRGATA